MRYGRDPAEMVPRRQNPKSMTVSVVLLIAVFALIIGFIIAVSVFVGRPTPPLQPPTPTALSLQKITSSNSSEVTSSACHVVGNETTCFRFASNFTTSWCSAVGGVIISVNSSSSLSSSSTSSSSSAAAAAATICYHSICLGFVVDNRFCFLNRYLPSSRTR